MVGEKKNNKEKDDGNTKERKNDGKRQNIRWRGE